MEEQVNFNEEESGQRLENIASDADRENYKITRKIPTGDVNKILEAALMRQRVEDVVRAKERVKKDVKDLEKFSETGYANGHTPIAVLYEHAKMLGVDRETLEKTLQAEYIREETIIQSLKKLELFSHQDESFESKQAHFARRANEVSCKAYELAQLLIDSLSLFHPEKKFWISEHYYGQRIAIYSQEKPNKFFDKVFNFFCRGGKERLAEISYFVPRNRLRLEIQNRLLFVECLEKISNFKERYPNIKDEFEFSVDYDPHSLGGAYKEENFV